VQDQKRSENDFPIEHTVFVVFGSDMFFFTKFLLYEYAGRTLLNRFLPDTEVTLRTNFDEKQKIQKKQ
jgi:hypothetical protein